MARVNSEIQILEPESLTGNVGNKGDGSLPYSVSTFGELLYTEHAVVQIVLPPDDNVEGCRPVLAPKDKSLPRFAWIFRRGTCTFSKKAFESQQSGSYVVFVYHDDPQVDVSNVIPISDSAFSNIKLPIVLISNQDGLKIVEALRAGNRVATRVHFQLEGGESDSIDFEYWMNPAALESYNFIINFRKNLREFGSSVKFSAKYKYRDLSGETNKKMYSQNCFADGRFCATETHGFDPVSVIREGLRQICLFNHSEMEKNNNDLWFRYIAAYRDCVQAKMRSVVPSARPCYEDIKERIGLDAVIARKIDQCADNSSDDPKDPYRSANPILESNRNKNEYASVYLVPAVFINRSLLKENLKPRIVMSAMCDKLKTKPSACSSYASSSIDWDYSKYVAKQRSLSAFFYVALFAIVLSLVAYFCFRKTAAHDIQAEIDAKIRTHVTEYMKIRDNR